MSSPSNCCPADAPTPRLSLEPLRRVRRHREGPFPGDFPPEGHNTLTSIDVGGGTQLTLKGGAWNGSDAERAFFAGMRDSHVRQRHLIPGLTG